MTLYFHLYLSTNKILTSRITNLHKPNIFYGSPKDKYKFEANKKIQGTYFQIISLFQK